MAFAAAGRGSVYDGENAWGAIYEAKVDLTQMKAAITILYDGGDGGGGQFESPDHGIRNPDNLDWAADGFLYVQEDNAKDSKPFFGSLSGEETSIFQMNIETGNVKRIAQITRPAQAILLRETKIPPSLVNGSPRYFGCFRVVWVDGKSPITLSHRSSSHPSNRCHSRSQPSPGWTAHFSSKGMMFFFQLEGSLFSK